MVNLEIYQFLKIIEIINDNVEGQQNQQEVLKKILEVY
jgi:hypothetical protein